MHRCTHTRAFPSLRLLLYQLVRTYQPLVAITATIIAIRCLIPIRIALIILVALLFLLVRFVHRRRLDLFFPRIAAIWPAKLSSSGSEISSSAPFSSSLRAEMSSMLS